jgi:hypothetical protein
MSGTFQYGAVVFWKGFEFEDGGSSNKLLVVLGAKTGQPIIAVLATSKAHRRKAVPGCHAIDGYFFIKGGGPEGFPKDTWLELNRPVEIAVALLVKSALTQDSHVQGNLPPQHTNEIRNCLKQSPDITPYQISLLQ